MNDFNSQPLSARLDLLDKECKENILELLVECIGEGYADDFNEQVKDYLIHSEEEITTKDGITYSLGDFFNKWDFRGRVWVRGGFALEGEEV